LGLGVELTELVSSARLAGAKATAAIKIIPAIHFDFFIRYAINH
jgi:hypothetical protein